MAQTELRPISRFPTDGVKPVVGEGDTMCPRWCADDALAAELNDVFCGWALQALDHVELHPLALGEALEALALQGRVVHKDVLLAVVAC